MCELNLILGPMFAGKSTYLINKVNELLHNNILLSEILVINHLSDSRYDTDKICSHNNHKINAISLHSLDNTITTIINKTDETYNKIKYIFIDEGQFFNDLYKSIKKLLVSLSLSLSIMNVEDTNITTSTTKNSNLVIYICGLDGDFKQEPFNNSGILELIPYATNITKLNSICFKCTNTAPFTKRIINSSETILIGGSEQYQPSCLLHLY